MSEESPIQRARNLRRAMTPSEKKMWEKLRQRRFCGLRFQRQYLIVYQHNQTKADYFIVDFYCHEKKLVVEIDGKIHNQQKEEDKHREEILRNLGYHIIRFKNEELHDIQEVLYRLIRYIENI